METLASEFFAPANADLAPVGSGEADADLVNAEGDGSAPSSPEAGTPAPKDKVQERIDKLTREKYDALRERDQRDYELQSLRERVAQIEAAKSETPQVAPDTFPTLEQYGYDESKYQAAVAAHFSKIATEQGKTAAQETLRAEREADQRRKAGETWSQREAELIKSKPDYVEKVQQARFLPISVEVQETLRGHELGPQVAYHLVENPDVARAILRLPIQAQLMEVGRITARIEAAKAPPKPAVSQAPPPPAKIDATGADLKGISSADPESHKLSDDEWVRAETARLKRKLKRAS